MEETLFRRELQKRTAAIEELLKVYLLAEEGYQKTVIEAMNYSLMAGGKRLRPMLMQETYKMFGGKDDTIEPFMAAIRRRSSRRVIYPRVLLCVALGMPSACALSSSA